MLRALRKLSFRTKSIIYNEVIFYHPRVNPKNQRRLDPLFFLADRRIDYVPAVSVTHHLDFEGLKILEYFKMSSTEEHHPSKKVDEKIFDPPESVRGMTKLDRSCFKKVVKIPCLRVPAKKIQSCRDLLNRYKLKMPNLSPVIDLNRSDPDFDKYKLLLLNPLLLPDKFADGANLVEKQASLEEYDLKMTYHNWDFVDLIAAVLPQDQKVSGFSTVGHIAHFNLRDTSLPYKHVIGINMIVTGL